MAKVRAINLLKRKKKQKLVESAHLPQSVQYKNGAISQNIMKLKCNAQSISGGKMNRRSIEFTSPTT